MDLSPHIVQPKETTRFSSVVSTRASTSGRITSPVTPSRNIDHVKTTPSFASPAAKSGNIGANLFDEPILPMTPLREYAPLASPRITNAALASNATRFQHRRPPTFAKARYSGVSTIKSLGTGRPYLSTPKTHRLSTVAVPPLPSSGGSPTTKTIQLRLPSGHSVRGLRSPFRERDYELADHSDNTPTSSRLQAVASELEKARFLDEWLEDQLNSANARSEKQADAFETHFGTLREQALRSQRRLSGLKDEVVIEACRTMSAKEETAFRSYIQRYKDSEATLRHELEDSRKSEAAAMSRLSKIETTLQENALVLAKTRADVEDLTSELAVGFVHVSIHLDSFHI